MTTPIVTTFDIRVCTNKSTNRSAGTLRDLRSVLFLIHTFRMVKLKKVSLFFMLNILKEPYFSEHYKTGFVDTGIRLPDDLVARIRQNYAQLEDGHNDFPKFFVNNEHQAYLEGAMIGWLLNTFRHYGRKMVARFYDKAYRKAVYCNQTCLEPVLHYVLAAGLHHIFDARYLVAGYDMYLRNDDKCPPAGIHIDLPNFHHFYETENDLSLYIPLVDLDDENGGRISVLPDSKLKPPGNVLLKMMVEHFSKTPAYLDQAGYIDPDLIDEKAIQSFIKSAPHQTLMRLYQQTNQLAKQQHQEDFTRVDESAGNVLMFSNKNYHAAEQWRNSSVDREVYVVRLFPIYDVPIKLRQHLHGALFNNYLIDTHRGSLEILNRPVDFATIPAQDKVVF